MIRLSNLLQDMTPVRCRIYSLNLHRKSESCARVVCTRNGFFCAGVDLHVSLADIRDAMADMARVDRVKARWFGLVIQYGHPDCEYKISVPPDRCASCSVASEHVVVGQREMALYIAFILVAACASVRVSDNADLLLGMANMVADQVASEIPA